MIYDVTAIAVNPDTGELIGQRTEQIDTAENEVFKDCLSEWGIEDAYEDFWNRLDESWETNFPEGKEKVKVISVKRIG